jgi:hypothetical protein
MLSRIRPDGVDDRPERPDHVIGPIDAEAAVENRGCDL